MRYRNLVLAAALLSMILTACGGNDDTNDSSSTTDAHGSASHDDSEASHQSSIGEPADPADATRTITVTMDDAFAYSPSALDVAAGETVRFEVTNTGSIVHEFVLGDDDDQEAHAEEMREMGGDMVHDDVNAVGVEPGTTATLAWTFDEPGTVIYGCHVTGHWEAGMKGTITVS